MGFRNLQDKLTNSVFFYTWSTSWLISPAYCVVVWLSKVDLIGIPSLLTTMVPITPLIGQEQINDRTDFLSIPRINIDSRVCKNPKKIWNPARPFFFWFPQVWPEKGEPEILLGETRPKAICHPQLRALLGSIIQSDYWLN